MGKSMKYKFIFIACVLGWLYLGFIVTEYNRAPVEWFEHVLFYFQLLWVSPILFALGNFLGVLGKQKQMKKANKTPVLHFVWVARGQNDVALKHAIQETKKNMWMMKDSIYHVVTDLPLDLGLDYVHHIVVPEDYQTKNGAKFKARALEYWRITAQIPENEYILHLDEESVVDESFILGYRQYLATYPTRIGQGTILYNGKRQFMYTILTTSLVDCVRVGDDVGRFRFQYDTFSSAFFGMHGSYILIPSHVLNRLTWDMSSGSITEDAELAMRAMQSGVKFCHVEGFVIEQSPQSIRDLIKQRKRWFFGIAQLLRYKGISMKYKLGLLLMFIPWSVSWLIPYVTLVSFLSGTFIPDILILPTMFIAGVSMGIYLLGLHMQLDTAYTKFSMIDYMILYVLLILGLVLQIIPIIETLGVLSAIMNPPKGFDVIKK